MHNQLTSSAKGGAPIAFRTFCPFHIKATLCNLSLFGPPTGCLIGTIARADVVPMRQPVGGPNREKLHSIALTAEELICKHQPLLSAS